MKIQEAAKTAGVSVRTLRYYDRIGLLKPQSVAENGYRVYGTAELERLQQILFFRELGFPLGEIREIMARPDYDRDEALRRQKALLILERDRLSAMIELAERTLKGERDMSFDAFDRSEIERTRAAYAREARERWGDTPAYRESERRMAGYDEGQRKGIDAGMEEIFRGFAALRGQEPGSEAVQAQVAAWQRFVTEHFYACTKEILAGLGQMYTADERFRVNLDRYGEGTAQLMADAIAVYCKD